MPVRWLSSLKDIAARQWDLGARPYPFLSYAFLRALEDSGSVGAAQGWQPLHLLVEEQGRPLAAVPLYVKSHSFGEYVFDWAWARAYEQHGLDYYPKLLTAIPFTPCVGPRLQGDPRCWPTILHSLEQLCQQQRLSGWHCLFPDATSGKALQVAASLVRRSDVQYRWYNHGYGNFSEFLSTFSSRKRKMVRKERQQLDAFEFVWLQGRDITELHWDIFNDFYRATYGKHSGHGGYLSREFFSLVRDGLGEQVLLNLAYLNGQPVAGALFFRDDHNLYGRYWGCAREYDKLHFECCYYQGIDYAITHRLASFDAGAQGEHKLQRGFEPVLTRSYHFLREPRFQAAIEDFARREEHSVVCYYREAREALPYKSRRQSSP